MVGKKTIVLAAVLLVAVIIISSFVYLNSQKTYAGQIESITMGMLPNENAALIYVAQNQQYFIANGINLTLRDYISGVTAIDGLLNGKADVVLTSDYILAVTAFRNVSVCTFGSIAKGTSLYLLGSREMGINSIPDLKGKTIGVASGTAGDFYLGRFLELNGLELNQVTIVNVPYFESPNALANGTVAAVVSVQPFITTIQNQLGNRSITWSVQSDQPYYVDAVCMRNWAADHPELVVRFLRALIQAQDYISNSPEKAMAIVANKLNYNSSYLSTVWADFQFSLSLDQAQISAMQDEARWSIDNNLVNATAIPDFSNYIYVEGLKTVAPGAVSIIG